MSKQAYYAARAIDERLRSQSAKTPAAAAAHLEMSARYKALASYPNSEPPSLELRILKPLLEVLPIVIPPPKPVPV